MPGSGLGSCSRGVGPLRSEGQLNDRVRAQAEIAVALLDLSGPDWSKVRNFLNDRRSLAFLDRCTAGWSRRNRVACGVRPWHGDGGCVTAGFSLRRRGWPWCKPSPATAN